MILDRSPKINYGTAGGHPRKVCSGTRVLDWLGGVEL